MTVREAAAALAVTEAAIRKWLYQRRLRAVKVGRLTRLRRADVEAVIAQSLRPAAVTAAAGSWRSDQA
jgi:excisionase family DNA binding protein